MEVAVLPPIVDSVVIAYGDGREVRDTAITAYNDTTTFYVRKWGRLLRSR